MQILRFHTQFSLSANFSLWYQWQRESKNNFPLQTCNYDVKIFSDYFYRSCVMKYKYLSIHHLPKIVWFYFRCHQVQAYTYRILHLPKKKELGKFVSSASFLKSKDLFHVRISAWDSDKKLWTEEKLNIVLSPILQQRIY